MEKEANFKLLNCWEASEIPPDTSLLERRRLLESKSLLSETVFTEPLCTVQTDMPFHEELIVMLCWLLFFAIPLWGLPFLLYLLYTDVTTGAAAVAICVAVAKIPTPQNTKLCYHYLATLTLKYFSFRAIWKDTVPKGTYIGVTPPHGLFPIGGILGVFALPR